MRKCYLRNSKVSLDYLKFQFKYLIFKLFFINPKMHFKGVLMLPR